jgi:hypothetical protein
MNRKLLALLFASVGIGVLSAPAHGRITCLGPKINFGQLPYSALPELNNLSNIGAYDEDVLRTRLMTGLTAAYRGIHGLSTLPVGSTFKMVYKDGSRECGRVDSRMGSVQAMPVENSQRPYAGPGEVEETSSYLNLFNRNRPQSGFYQVCWDYYTNGVLTDSECEIHPA